MRHLHSGRCHKPPHQLLPGQPGCAGSASSLASMYSIWSYRYSSWSHSSCMRPTTRQPRASSSRFCSCTFPSSRGGSVLERCIGPYTRTATLATLAPARTAHASGTSSSPSAVSAHSRYAMPMRSSAYVTARSTGFGCSRPRSAVTASSRFHTARARSSNRGGSRPRRFVSAGAASTIARCAMKRRPSSSSPSGCALSAVDSAGWTDAASSGVSSPTAAKE
mmetsp:Transcript_37816/g.98166  ORF Transcript_37816/g.98166 Transcript_37816/m.98166 type:complete len:221 (-) Transcript_37816:746-1408(-)